MTNPWERCPADEELSEIRELLVEVNRRLERRNDEIAAEIEFLVGQCHTCGGNGSTYRAQSAADAVAGTWIETPCGDCTPLRDLLAKRPT